MNAMRLSGRATGLLLLAAILACSRKPASLQVSPRKLVIYGIDRGQRLTVQVLDNKGEVLENARPTWTSAKAEVAAVDESGRVVSKAEGKTTVTAQVGEKTAEIPVEVIDIASIEVKPAQATLAGPPGTNFPLSVAIKGSKGQPVSVQPAWESSSPKSLTVSPDGIVTSVANGKAMVTARIGELQGASEVSVLVGAISRLDLQPATALVRVGDSQRFRVVAFGPDGNRLENAVAGFHSANPAVATIDGDGVAVGVAAGTTTIRVDLAGQTAEATLIVN
jgi:hypothetical protein